MSQPSKHALLIGINRYLNLPQRQFLKGCVNDVKALSSVLQGRFGFPINDPASTTILTDDQATRAAILAGLDKLAQNVRQDDIVVIFYSGHGSEIADLDGDSASGQDETIVPYDTSRTETNTDITDDEIYAKLVPLTQSTRHITLIFDCCHSGTITRDAFGASARWLEPDSRSGDELRRARPQGSAPSRATGERGNSRWLPLSDRYVLIAGCRDNELSFEYKIPGANPLLMHGTLTYFLCQELQKVEAQAAGLLTYRDLFERVSAQVTAVQRRQHPQLEGLQDMELFGVRDLKPMRFVPVLKRRAAQVTLSAGAAHGVTIGSRWGIYAPGTGRVDEQTPKLGDVEITAVRAVDSTGRVLAPATLEAIQAGTRAVETTHAHAGGVRDVLIDVPAGFETQKQQLEAAISRSGLLRLAQGLEAADYCAYILTPRDQAGPGDHVPQIKRVDRPTWAIVHDQLVSMPLHAVDEPGVASVLCENLEKLVRYDNALKLANPNPNSKLKGKIDLIVRKRMPDGSIVEAERDAKGQAMIFRAGDRLAVTIVNRHDHPVFVSLLDFGLTGKIDILHPQEAASERVAAGASIEIGVRPDDWVDLSLPDDFPFTPDPGEARPAGGTETLKLIAATTEADFRMLVQEAVRDLDDLRNARGRDTQVFQLVTKALQGLGETIMQALDPEPEQDWTTVERSFFLSAT